MHINQIAAKPDNFGPRFVRTIKPDGVRCCGKILPDQDAPHNISTPHMARHIMAGMNRECNDAGGREGFEAGALVVLRRALTGEPLSTFYADYVIHPDDAAKGLTLADSL